MDGLGNFGTMLPDFFGFIGPFLDAPAPGLVSHRWNKWMVEWSATWGPTLTRNMTKNGTYSYCSASKDCPMETCK